MSFSSIFKNKWKITCSGTQVWWIRINFHYLEVRVPTWNHSVFMLSTPQRIEKSLSPQTFLLSMVSALAFLLQAFISGCLPSYRPYFTPLPISDWMKKEACKYLNNRFHGLDDFLPPSPEGSIFAPHFLGSHPQRQQKETIAVSLRQAVSFCAAAE